MNITDPNTPFSLHLNNFSNLDATAEAGEQNHAGLAPSGTVWYKWTSSNTGWKGVQISLRRSNFDTVIAVYKYNQFNDLTLVAENNDISTGNNRSHISFFAEPLDTYYVAVGNGPGSGAGGTIKMDMSPAITRSSPDFDGDGVTDFAVYRPSDNTYYIATSREGSMIFHKWGSPGDIVVPANITKQYKPAQTDFIVFRPSTGYWHMLNTDSPGTLMRSVHFGHADDIPVVGNFTNSADPDVAVYRPSDSTWYFENINAPFFSAIKYGLPGDIPVAGDYDNDSGTDIAVFRPSNGNWYITSSQVHAYEIHWGQAGDIPLRGDYDGDGISDICVFRPSDGAWYIRRSRNGGFQSMSWGQAGDIPVAGDFNADGYYDYAVFRPSTGYWHVHFNGVTAPDVSFHWGMQGDVPLGGAMPQ
jgi:hypothetical protein